MKVKDLIERLKNFSAETDVLVQGYEDGFDNVVSIKEVKVVRRSQPRDWEGECEEAEKGTRGAVTAMVIMGNRR